MILNFKKYFYESIGAGSMLPTTWTGSQASDTMGLTGHPLNLPEIDIALPPEGTVTPELKKSGIVKDFIFNKDPITVILDDGTVLYFTYDEYKRIQGDLPLVPKLTRLEISFQTLPTSLYSTPSKINFCKAIFTGSNGHRKLHKIQNSINYPNIRLA
jgi:hypothetical protein